MFSGVRQNNLFYILEKENEPKLRIGQVVSVSNPQLQFGQPYGQPADSFVDITVKVDGETMEFKKLPSSSSIADSGKGGVIVSDSKEVMNREVESMLQSSQSILDRIDYHKKVVQNCNQILRVLNPRLAKEKERDDDISNLKNKIGGLEDKMDKILTILSKDGSK